MRLELVVAVLLGTYHAFQGCAGAGVFISIKVSLRTTHAMYRDSLIDFDLISIDVLLGAVQMMDWEALPV
jgi:hypothetical protein